MAKTAAISMRVDPQLKNDTEAAIAETRATVEERIDAKRYSSAAEAFADIDE